jgi:hypothetical protein
VIEMFTDQDMLTLESYIREILEIQRKLTKMTETALGEKAFPAAGDSRRKVQSIRNKAGHGKPQRIKIGELFNLCEALSLNWSEVLAEAKAKTIAGKKEY